MESLLIKNNSARRRRHETTKNKAFTRAEQIYPAECLLHAKEVIFMLSEMFRV